jgi:trigger factor
MDAVEARIEELPDDRVKLEVDVEVGDVDHAFEHAASELAGSMSFPGFRKGKNVPMPVVAARVGQEALANEAVRSHIPGWFWNAASESRLRPVADPELEWDALPVQGEPFTFRAVVDVLPAPELGDWKGLEVPRPGADIPPEIVEAELERVRASVAELSPVTGRTAAIGDTVVVDLLGDETTRDYVIEVGHGRLRQEIEAAIVGSSVGDTRSATVQLSDAKPAKVDVTVKEISEKVLPPLDDELALKASEFDTLAELEADIQSSLGEQLEAEIDVMFRERALDALAEASTFEKLEPVVEARARSLWQGLARSLDQRGISVEGYLAASGRTPEDVDTQLRAEAEVAVKRELVLETLADELAVEITDDEVEEFIREESEGSGEDWMETVEELRENEGFEKLRLDLTFKNALDEVVAAATPIEVELAEARDKLWTPEKESDTSSRKIWTPGSEVDE